MLMRDPLQNSPGYSLRRASIKMMGELTGRLAALDLRMADATVLMLIEANPAITASRIGRALDIQRANMVPLLKRMEEAGLVDRAPIDGTFRVAFHYACVLHFLPSVLVSIMLL